MQKAHTLRYRYRLDRDIYDWLRRYGAGYSARINNILRAVMSGGGSAVHFHA